MAKLMGIETSEQNKIALYLFNNIKIQKINVYLQDYIKNDIIEMIL